jgi:hypothetical protein
MILTAWAGHLVDRWRFIQAFLLFKKPLIEDCVFMDYREDRWDIEPLGVAM